MGISLPSCVSLYHCLNLSFRAPFRAALPSIPWGKEEHALSNQSSSTTLHLSSPPPPPPPPLPAAWRAGYNPSPPVHPTSSAKSDSFVCIAVTSELSLMAASRAVPISCPCLHILFNESYSHK